ncbi:hypothetical protein Pint_11623 [Pistacia integerrima]|uniref:Uncharacterized protein n=1 Tax=Pistacia integerrima TaxID=434235 RepID=A0ACC0XIN5_9ROSI|nr:hypothetical protein Pint_11623 [Pistacia integerrima]
MDTSPSNEDGRPYGHPNEMNWRPYSKFFFNL